MNNEQYPTQPPQFMGEVEEAWSLRIEIMRKGGSRVRSFQMEHD